MKIPRIWPALLSLAIAIGIMFVAALATQINFSNMTRMTDARAGARTARLNLEHVLSLFKDLETGARGFVITGQPSYLKPYFEAKRALPEAYARLKKTPAESLPEGFSWDQLDVLVAHRYELADRAVASRQNKGGVVIENIALFDEGKRTMDGIRAEFALLDAFEDRRIAKLSAAVYQLRYQAQLFSWLTAAMAALLVTITIYLMLKERKARVGLEQALRQTNLSLEDKISERTRDLEAARDRIAGFALEQENAIEAERRRLSREVHDQIGQVFTAIKLIIGSIPEHCFPAGQQQIFGEALESGIASTRRITAELRPPLLDDLGLEAALEHFIGQFAGGGHLQYEINVAKSPILTEARTLGLFRISQEAVTNIVRHAQAAKVTVCGEEIEEQYRFMIEDDGRGLDLSNIRPGAMGLTGMRERAALLGGECHIVSQPGAGTRIVITLPAAHT